jgi:3-phosphoglycerate kinase
MANTFLAARGYSVGKSLCERDLLPTAREIMAQAKAKSREFVLPQTGRLLPMIQLRLGRPTDQKESTDEGLSQNHQNQPFSIWATDLTTGDYRGSGLVQ